jgi:hypothetical protein
LWASATPVNCPVDGVLLLASNDFNCNGQNGLVVACGNVNVTRVSVADHDTSDEQSQATRREAYFRQIGEPDVFANISNTDYLGTCTFNATTHNCTLKPGFVVEADGAHVEHRHRKRATAEQQQFEGSHHRNHKAPHGGGVDSTPECRGEEVTTIDTHDLSKNLTQLLRFGDCGEFASGCTSLNGTCYQDCDICVLIAH